VRKNCVICTASNLQVIDLLGDLMIFAGDFISLACCFKGGFATLYHFVLETYGID